MTTLREAAEMALRSMEEAVTYAKFARAENYINPDAIKSLREALEQPEREPVAWTTMPDANDWTFVSGSANPNGKLNGKWYPLYATPPQRKPLTDDEIRKLWDSHTIEVYGKIGINPVLFARYLEREYGIGEKE